MMHDALKFVMQHGYAVLFVWVLAEQLGCSLAADTAGSRCVRGSCAGVLQAAYGSSAKGSMRGGWAMKGRRAISATARVICFSLTGSSVITNGNFFLEWAGS